MVKGVGVTCWGCVGTLRPHGTPEHLPAAAAHVDADEDGADEDVARADGLDGIDRLGIVERPSALALVAHAEPEAGHQLALPPAEVGASVTELDPLDVQVVSVVDEDPHALVDTHKKVGAIEPDRVLVPGHGVLGPGSWAGDDQISSYWMLVELRGDVGQPGLLAQLVNYVGDGLYPFLGVLLLHAGGQAASDGHLGPPAAAAALKTHGDGPGAAGGDVGQGSAVAGVQLGAPHVAQPDPPLLAPHTAAVAFGPVPEGGEEAEELPCVVVLDVLASVHKSHRDVLGWLHVHVVAVEEIPFLSAAQVEARVCHLGPEDDETEHPDAETLQHVAAHVDMARVKNHVASKVRQDRGFLASHGLLEVPDDVRDLLGLAVARELKGHVGQVSGVVKHQESRTNHSLEYIFFLLNRKRVEHIYHAEEKYSSWQPGLHHAQQPLPSAG